ncbi:MAG: D-2-hydroxyacid dehydrogenase family protein [Planctomycetes bacterium]|nr:D-2-hydroxyacid dehydrogenase family protein [Planctomycetota bacterium]
MNHRACIVVPADDPPQLQGSPHLERLQSYGEVVLHASRPASNAEKIERCLGAVCMINSRSAVQWPGAVLERLSALKMITVCGIGTDAIDLEAARRLDVVVCNIPGRTASIVAEHALALMFAVARQAWHQTDLLKKGRWLARNLVYLQGKTLGVLGLGSIGREMARLGTAVGMRVQGWTLHPTPERSHELGIPLRPLEEVLRTSDVISVHLKLTDQSRGLLGRGEFALMKPGAIFVNTARGAIADESALVDALHSGRLGGAGIDVFAVEPIPADHPLLHCEQVVLTPHIADQTSEGMDLLNGGAVDNVIAFLEGEPRNRVV